jgi:hypothetical protein
MGFPQKIGSSFQLADKALTVVFKNHRNLLAEFNSDPTTILARQRGKPLESDWRREGDSNHRRRINKSLICNVIFQKMRS